MRVKAGPDAAAARRHVSARRLDISGTFSCDLSLLGHRVCCREQHDGTDCKNDLLHTLSSSVLTNCVHSPRANVQSLTAYVGGLRSFGQLTCGRPPHQSARNRKSVAIVAAIVRPIRITVRTVWLIPISVRRLVRTVSVSIVPVISAPIRAPMYPAINAGNASRSEGTTNLG
jgi:hypothetical protein